MINTEIVKRDVKETETKEIAISFSKQVIEGLIDKGLNFLLAHKENEIKIVAVKDADLVKHYFPAFKINLDERKQRFAELIIKYE